MYSPEKQLSTHLAQLSDRLAMLLKTHQVKAQEFFIGLKVCNWSWRGTRCHLDDPTSDAKSIYRYCAQLIEECLNMPEQIVQIQLAALDVNRQASKLDLFKPKTQKFYVSRVLDSK